MMFGQRASGLFCKSVSLTKQTVGLSAEGQTSDRYILVDLDLSCREFVPCWE